jgi:hypothetical protein
VNRRQRRALDAKSKGAFTNMEASDNAYRILTNVLRIIESTPFAGAKTAMLVLESYEYMQNLRGQLHRPANAPLETEGPLLERVHNEVRKENSVVSESGAPTPAPNADDQPATPEATPAAE